MINLRIKTDYRMLEHPISNCKDKSKALDGTSAPNCSCGVSWGNSVGPPSHDSSHENEVLGEIFLCAFSALIYHFLIIFTPLGYSLPLPQKVRAGLNQAAVQEALSDCTTSHCFLKGHKADSSARAHNLLNNFYCFHVPRNGFANGKKILAMETKMHCRFLS